MDITQIILLFILAIYILCLLVVLLYSITQGYLAYSYLKKLKAPAKRIFTEDQWPVVTVQLPIYNERYVTQRLIDAVVNIEYPKNKLEIQVLDDSTDDTTTIARECVQHWSEQGYDITYIHRIDRSGYKAGALKAGLEKAEGQYIAIFDADFVPKKDFLKKTIPLFHSHNIGMVQTRWEHLNRNDSVLTRSLAFMLDAHFRVEQNGRNAADCYINFNGTAGVWRKDCILDAGNWQSDTLTEDLDLSYRAQLKGWQFIYTEDVDVPAEIPPVMSAIKSQQYRWNKGGAETAKKVGKSLLKAPIPFRKKWYGMFHLANSTVFIAVFLSAFCSIPLLHFKKVFPAFQAIYGWLSIFLISFFIFSWIYYIVFKKHHPDDKNVLLKYLKEFPLYMSFSMGISFHNAWAVVEGLIGKKTPFIRTPKFNTIGKNDYVKTNISIISLLEILLTIYFAYGIYYAILSKDFSMLPFHTMLTLGFALVSYHTIFPKYKNNIDANTNE